MAKTKKEVKPKMETLYNITPDGKPYDKKFEESHAARIMANKNNGGWSREPYKAVAKEEA